MVSTRASKTTVVSDAQRENLAKARKAAAKSRKVKQYLKLKEQVARLEAELHAQEKEPLDLVSSENAIDNENGVAGQGAAVDAADTPFRGTDDESEHECSKAARMLSQCRQPEGPSKTQCSGAASMLRTCSSNTEADVAREVVDPVETSRRRDVATEVDDEGTASPGEDHKTHVCKLHRLRSCDDAQSVSSAGSTGMKALERALYLTRVREVRQS